MQNAENRMIFVQANLPTIEGWLENNVENVPPATELPITTNSPPIPSEGQTDFSSAPTGSTDESSSIIIETTTGGGSNHFASIHQLFFVILSAVLSKSMM